MPSGSSILSRIKTAHSDHRAIAQGMVLGASFVFLSKVVGAAKEIAVAWRYGVSEIVDSYLYVLNLVTWPVTVWFGVLAVVLIPVAAKIREQMPDELPRFRPELLGLTLLSGVFFLIAGEVALPFFLRSPLSGLSASATAHGLEIAPALALLALLGFPISLFSVWTMAAGRFTNTLQEGIPAAVILIVVMAVPSATAWPLVIGTVVGYAIHLLSLTVSLARARELERPRFLLRSPQWSGFWKGFAIVLAGQAVLSLSTVIDQLFAARLGAGAISTLGYANRIIALILGLGATAVSRASLPVFSASHARGDMRVKRRAAQWSILLFLGGLVTVLIGWWLAHWVVSLLFERGAFSAADSNRVADVFRFALFQVPFYFSSLVLVSLVSARHNYGLLALGGIIGIMVKLVGNTVLVPWLGLRGLVLVNSFVYAAGVLFLTVVLQRADRPVAA